jgi:hypothetical protein
VDAPFRRTGGGGERKGENQREGREYLSAREDVERRNPAEKAVGLSKAGRIKRSGDERPTAANRLCLTPRAPGGRSPTAEQNSGVRTKEK